MKQSDERIVFNSSESAMCDANFVHIDDLIPLVTHLRRKADTLYARAFKGSTEVGDMLAFYAASEIEVLANKLEGLAPELSNNGLAQLDSDLMAMLDRAAEA